MRGKLEFLVYQVPLTYQFSCFKNSSITFFI